MQTGLDLVRIGLKTSGFVVLLSVEGLLFGSLGSHCLGYWPG
jgi:hypothetical protein